MTATFLRRLLAGAVFVGALTSAPVALAAPADGRVGVIVRFHDAPSQRDVAGLERAGARVTHRYGIVPAVAAELPAAAVDTVARRRGVAEVEPDQIVRGLDYRATHDWGIGHIRADLVHSDLMNTGTSLGGARARVAVLDSGIDCRHAELDANCLHGETYIAGTTSPDDDWGHGTHVAGTVAAERDTTSTTGVVGTAPTAQVVAYKVLDDGGYGTISDVIAAVDHVWNGGSPRSEVINMSLGWGSGSTSFEASMNRAYGDGIVLVAAAGNGGNCGGSGNSVSYPARYPAVIAVAAVDASNQRPCWSSTGDAVELAAPGVSVFSTWPSRMSTSYRDPQPVCEVVLEADTCHFKYGSGTSMSVPHVAGAAALIVASGIADANGANGVADEVRQRLTSTAVDLGASGRDRQFGHGLVDARAATPTSVEGTTGGGTEEQPAEPTSITLSVSGYKHRGDKHIDLAWSGATGDLVDIVRDGTVIATGDPNDGAFHDHPPKGADTHTYEVCEAGTQTCSNEATISF